MNGKRSPVSVKELQCHVLVNVEVIFHLYTDGVYPTDTKVITVEHELFILGNERGFFFSSPGETMHGISKKPYSLKKQMHRLLFNVAEYHYAVDSSCLLIKSKQVPSFPPII